MKIQFECSVCSAIYTVAYSQPDPVHDDTDYSEDVDITIEESEEDIYPEFCPFCGAHASEDADDTVEDA